MDESESKLEGLPPGPWRVDGKLDDRIVDASGAEVLGIALSPNHEPMLFASPEVFRAIEALPMLVEAMRATIEELEWLAVSPRYRSAFRLRQALALVDREGVAGG